MFAARISMGWDCIHLRGERPNCDAFKNLRTGCRGKCCVALRCFDNPYYFWDVVFPHRPGKISGRHCIIPKLAIKPLKKPGKAITDYMSFLVLSGRGR